MREKEKQERKRWRGLRRWKAWSVGDGKGKRKKSAEYLVSLEPDFSAGCSCDRLRVIRKRGREGERFMRWRPEKTIFPLAAERVIVAPRRYQTFTERYRHAGPRVILIPRESRTRNYLPNRIPGVRQQN